MKRKLIAFLLAFSFLVSVGLTAAATTTENEFTFSYKDETYTIGVAQWENGKAMPMTFAGENGGGIMQMDDDGINWEFVVCIRSGETGNEIPAEANIFAKIDDVSYTADISYMPESVGKVVMGDVVHVTRDTSEGTGNIPTKAFTISAAGDTYFDMDITVKITLKLDGKEVTLTQSFNAQKPSNGMGMRTLRLDNYIDECDTTEELQSIIKDRESLWRFYAQKSGCSVDELMELTGDALKVVLPAGTYGDLFFDISDMTTTVGEFTDTNGNGSDRQIRFNGPVMLWGSDESDGTTIGSLTYTGADCTGMSGITKINFSASTAEKDYGFMVTGAASGNGDLWASPGVNNCTFTGYKVAVSSVNNGYANPSGCTFSNNDTAISINCGDGANVYSNLTHCTFINNGTAVYLQSLGASCSPYSFRVTMCDFIGNDTEVNYQPAGKFYLFNNYYRTVDGKLKRKATVIEGEDTTIKQGVWRDQSFKSDVTGYGIADEGVVVNNDSKTLTDEYLEAVTFDVIAADTENSETVGTWTFE